MQLKKDLKQRGTQSLKLLGSVIAFPSVRKVLVLTHHNGDFYSPEYDRLAKKYK